MAIPPDYLERVYAGVLGKLIGVYLGRPFEGWTHQRILQELGHITDYVHEQLDQELVVTDDDVSGTFGFVRALEEHGATATKLPSAQDVGRTWLNNVVERKSVFWWGGRGVSTEHTAFSNLQRGIAAPHSGSIATNGTTVAEQIGAQIFIDGWALVAPGNPQLAAQLAEAAGKVSHDGESVHAARLWAAMEAEAFVSADVDHLLDTGLRFVPQDSHIAALVRDVRAWAESDGDDWLATRQRIEDKYGYDKFEGACHVMPNHAVMVLALVRGASRSFHEAMHIVNTCGWDTDCNSGNVGCLAALMHGLPAFEGGPDWRGPLADRALLSTADGGYSINDAARIAADLVGFGRRLAGLDPLPAPKDGAQFHFSLPGSVQGFRAFGPPSARVEQAVGSDGIPALAVRLAALADPVEVLTTTFTPKEVLRMGPTYPLMASPLVYPGQRVYAVVRADSKGTSPVSCRLRLRVYAKDDELVAVDGPVVQLVPGGAAQTLEWTIPDALDSQPIQQLGVALLSEGSPFSGTVWLDRVGWSGTPNVVLRRPAAKPCGFWRRAWVDAVDDSHGGMTRSFCVAQNRGEGTYTTGTRDWADYRAVVSDFSVAIGDCAGVAFRVRGLHRYYALVLRRDADGQNRRVALVKARDEHRSELASAPFDWALDRRYEIAVEADGSTIRGSVAGVSLEATDGAESYASGGAGFVVVDGSLFADSIAIGAVNSTG